jgi:hypothetical protein
MRFGGEASEISQKGESIFGFLISNNGTEFGLGKEF